MSAKEYFIYKGSSNFCSELVMDDACETFIKQKPEGFYDIVSEKDTIEGGIHVIEMSTYKALEEKLKIAVEALKELGCDCGYDTIDGYGDSICIQHKALEKIDKALEKIEGKL